MENPQALASGTIHPARSAGDAELAELERVLAEKRAALPPQLQLPSKAPVETAVERLSRISPPLSPEEQSRRDAADREREIRRKNAERFSRWADLIRNRGIRYEGCRLDSFTATTDAQRIAVASLSDYARNIVERVSDGVNVILIGPAGTGKDHLLMGLCRYAIGADRGVAWKNGTSLWLEFRKAISEDEDESRVASRLVYPDVLAISDPIPPRGALSDYQAAMLFDVVDARYSSRKPVWVTLNCASRTEAEERIGIQVVDRLAHDALVVTCNWPSYRKGDT